MTSRSIKYGWLVMLGGLTVGGSAQSADFTCWQPNKVLVAAQDTEADAEYWTRERRDNAIPEDGEISPESTKPAMPTVTGRVNVAVAPYKYGGKLFYTRDGNDYSASAQFVAEDNVLLAAAHSMWRGDKFAQNVVFYRAYENGSGTRFVVDQAAVQTAWVPISANPPSAERSAVDYAALRTTKDSDAGKFTLSKDGTFTAVGMMGYPGNFDGGNYMNKQDSTKLAQVGGAYLAAPTEFGTGASGGAWIPPGSNPPIVSVVSSQILQDKTLAMRGPVLTDTTDAMIAYVKGGCK